MQRRIYILLILAFIFIAIPSISDAQTPEDCTNGLDDNGDGLIDCQDSTCFGIGNCDDCFNGTDNDGDGLIGCNEPDCTAGVLQCDPSGSEADCANGIDDDGNGRMDCQDPNCWGIDDCENCFEPQGDSDGNGQIACFDPDCFPNLACDPGFEADCSNSQDDDLDTLVDCEDPDCFNETVCNLEFSGGGCALSRGQNHDSGAWRAIVTVSAAN